jgi:hypothetical protein
VSQVSAAMKMLNATWISAMLLVQRVDEQRPAVLQVGDQHHAEDAEPELDPPAVAAGHRTTFGHQSLPASLAESRSSFVIARLLLLPRLLLLWAVCYGPSVISQP